MKIVVASGYFNPLHIGHLHYLQEAKKLGDELVVIVNNDNQVQLKGSVPFMKQEERLFIIDALQCVDYCYLSGDQDKTVNETLKAIHTIHGVTIFAKGGDSTIDNVPEYELCRKLGIRVITNVGGGKAQSSSILLKDINIYKQALIDIGNRVGSPVMEYAPNLALAEYERLQQDISKTVQLALKGQNAPDKR